MASGPREYDPEIKDIADYVANKPIDSELAVSFPAPPHPAIAIVACASKLLWQHRTCQLRNQRKETVPSNMSMSPLVRHCTMDSPRHPWLRS
jgi:hypothetical protein